MRGVGVMQAILVRPVTMPDGFRSRKGGEPQQAYEIIFGHRRYRAAKLAGLAPCRASCANSPTRRPRSCRRSRTCSARTWTRRRGARLCALHQGARRHQGPARRRDRPVAHARLQPPQAANARAGRAGRAARRRDLRRERAAHRADPHEKLQEKALERSARDYATTWTTAARRACASIRIAAREVHAAAERRDLRHEAAKLLPNSPAAAPRARSARATRPSSRTSHATREEGIRPGKPGAGPGPVHRPDCFEAKKKAHLANKAAELEAKGKTVITGGKARSAISADGTSRAPTSRSRT
jgi:hypothetical protein